MEMRLYYVTNRNHLGKDRFNPEGYGAHPSADGIENLRFGKVMVDVGVESFDEWFKVEVGSGKGNGVKLSEYLAERAQGQARIEPYAEKIPDRKRTEISQPGVTLGHQEMFEVIRSTMRQGRDVLIFVHGFNVSWHQAVGSALALEAMLNRPGIQAEKKKDVLVVLFTWPSDGSALPFVAYRSDRTEAIGSGFALGRGILRLRDFLAKVTQTVNKRGEETSAENQPCDQNLNLLCHSMGNYVLQNALQRIMERSETSRLPRMFDHIFLCSPDVDDDVLESGQPLGRLHEICRNVSIYFNRGDLALRGSDYTKGNPDRLGTDGVANPNQVSQKIYQIDCSGDIVQGVMEHSYYLKGRINEDIRKSLDNISQHPRARSRDLGRFPSTFIMK